MACGEIEFLGRIDTQVKIRGYRVELSEIEAVLVEAPEVKAATVALREDVPGQQQLVGYVVQRNSETFDEERLKIRLRSRLPAFMVPAIIETIVALPALASGKVDRKLLPPPRPRLAEADRDIVPPRTPLERLITTAWERVFAPAKVSVRDDFFLDLDGHSLLAARMVSELRRTPPLHNLSMLDIYKHPTIEQLAEKFAGRRGSRGEGQGERDPTVAARPSTLEPHPSFLFWRHIFCGTAQGVSLIFILSFFALQWLAPYLTYTLLIEEEFDFIEALAGALASLVVVYPLMLAIVVAVKWLVIGRYREGAYPLWGFYFFRWWFVTTIEATVPVGYMAGTPLLNIYARIMGAKIGRNVYLGSENFAIYDLLDIGEDSSVNVDASLPGYIIEDGLLKLGRVRIGKRGFVGTRSAVLQGAVVEGDSALEG